MTLKLKSNYNFNSLATVAAKERFPTEGSRLSEKDVDYAIAGYLKRQDFTTSPELLPGRPFPSRSAVEYIKDCKFATALNNLELGALSQEINGFRYFNETTLSSLEQELAGLESSISEEEIKQKEFYTTVHKNSFARKSDFGLSADDRAWMSDYKTRSSFLPSQVIHPVMNTGCMLPVVYEQQIQPKSIEIDVSRTTFCDGVLKQSHPNNLIEARPFEFAVIRTEGTGSAVCGLMIDFGRVVKINNLLFAAMAGLLEIYTVEFMPVENSWTALDFSQILVENEFKLVFSAIDTRYMYIEVRTNTSVYQGPLALNDAVKTSINEVLAGLNWSLRLTNSEEQIEGKILDLSVRKLQFFLTEYNHKGIFRSNEINVNKPVSMKLTDLALNVSDGILQPEYGTNFTFGDENHQVEYYLAGTFEDGSGLYAPIPTSVNEEEQLIFVGDVARCRFMPDLITGIPKTRAISIDGLIVVAENHGYHVGDQVIIGSKRTAISSVINSNSFTISTAIGAVNESTTPYVYVYKLSDLNYYISLMVSADGVAKVFGQDYLISLDSGESWISDRGVLLHTWLRLKDRLYAGDMYIKLTKPPKDEFYLINYLVYANQSLTKDSQLQLSYGKIIFAQGAQYQRGSLTTILVLRSTSHNVYSTPVVVRYCLKVRENVTQ